MISRVSCLFVSVNLPFFSRLKIEELEAERSKLEEENRSLEMKLEKLTLQVGNVELQSSWSAGHGPVAVAVLTVVPECSQHFSLPSVCARHFSKAWAKCTSASVSLTMLVECFADRCSHTNVVVFFDAFASDFSSWTLKTITFSITPLP